MATYKEDALKFLGITKWHAAGYTGKGIKVVGGELTTDNFRSIHTDKLKDVIRPVGFGSGKNAEHGTNMFVHLLTVAPDATCISYPFNGKFSSSGYECACAEYIKENKVDLFATALFSRQTVSDTYEQAIQDCIDSGCIFFICSGNYGYGGVQGESKSDKYWAIGAVELSDGKWIRANFSSVGEELDFVSIARPLGVSGTSPMTYMVTGMCGLVQQFFKEKAGRKLNREEMERFILDNSKDVLSEGFDNESGHGLFILPEPESIDINKYIGEEEKMNIRKDLLDESKYSLKCPNKLDVKYIVVHNTANDAPAKNEITYMKESNVQTSFHFAVDEEEIVQGIPLNRAAFHAGDGSDGKGNKYGIGVEICYSKSGGEKFIAAEKNAVKLIAYLLKKYSLPISAVITHKECSGKYCPHRTLDMGWDRFIDMIKLELGEEEENMIRYKTVDEMPEYYRKDIQELIDKGVIAGRGGELGLDLSDDMCRMAIYAKKIFENGGK